MSIIPCHPPLRGVIQRPGAGCLSRRIHDGSPSRTGGVGTSDPDKWQHLIWFDGQVHAAELLSDALGHVSGYEELREHFDRWRDSGKSPWRCVESPDHPGCFFMNTARTPLTPTEASRLLGVGWRFGDLLAGPGPDEQTQSFEVPVEWKEGTRHLFAATREQYREALARFDLTPDGEWLADPLPAWILPHQP